jgi:hypothetical protein
MSPQEVQSTAGNFETNLYHSADSFHDYMNAGTLSERVSGLLEHRRQLRPVTSPTVPLTPLGPVMTTPAVTTPPSTQPVVTTPASSQPTSSSQANPSDQANANEDKSS